MLDFRSSLVRLLPWIAAPHLCCAEECRQNRLPALPQGTIIRHTMPLATGARLGPLETVAHPNTIRLCNDCLPSDRAAAD